jgi:phytoene desaturase
MNVPASFEEVQHLFEALEPGSSERLVKYLEEASYKYEIGVQRLVYKPGRTLTEFLDWDVLKGIFRLDVFTSIQQHIRRHFKHPKLRQLMEFPVLFLGALPQHTPALYSLMNYADIKGGTWYPQGGMYAVVEGMYRLACELDVQFRFGEEAKEIVVERSKASVLVTDKNRIEADVIISGADYHFTETKLLNPSWQSYSDRYWNKKIMAPSCLLYYIGLNKKLRNIAHHSLFFDVPFDTHAQEIYQRPSWPSQPLFYVSVNSVSDQSVSPSGMDNLVLLIPVAAGLEGDDEDMREKYFNMIIQRMERHVGEAISHHIIYKKTFSVKDFVHDYNSFRGNAYGLANTLRQTAIFKPSCKSKKVKNLFYTGQLTVPGPGVPPCLISGEVVANEVLKEYGIKVN